ncbi:hypothetical protein BDW62DRAFT_209621 [Aspergillus aurantiobrunneus]
MAVISVQEAEAIVDDLKTRNGGLSPEERKKTPAKTLEVIRNLQSIAGGSIEHVAEDLYDADTRYIFELLQNAEDNSYGLAAGRQEAPFLHFILHRDHLNIDSNEDGFTEADVRSICSIHRSSKRQLGGYIGHKGIGFKSVFKIAYKVCIQSGPFCFYFEHRRGDGGLAMITPYNQPPEELPSGVKTRITLWLLDTEDFSTRASELREIPDTLLLFLRKLQILTIDIPALDYEVSYRRIEDTTKRLTRLIKRMGNDEHMRLYHMQKDTLSDLPEHHSRQGQDEIDLILAFPVDEFFNPVIEPQFVYSFLPMRREGFNFLIQSDFITQANRQGIHMCPRNYAIRKAICNLFVRAIHYFCSHDVLAYEWLQYLPGPQIHDTFWADLREMISEALSESQVLFCRTGNRLKRPRDLQHLSSRHCDRRGQPLLDDIPPEVYLSQSYNWSKHAENLMELGVTNLSFETILDRLSPYLLGGSPRYLDPALDDDWHTRIADLLLRAINSGRKPNASTERIKAMDLIPTSQGTLVSTKLTNVYFPSDDKDNVIPADLQDIPTVDHRALDNPSRRLLFEKLGVTHCNPARVIQSILRKYNRSDGVILADSVNHIRYLFQTLGKHDTLDKRIFIMSKRQTKIYRTFPTLGVPPPEPSATVVLSRSGSKKRHLFAASRVLTPKVIDLLKDMEVPCLNSPADQRSRLGDTYYPSRGMKQICADAGFENDFPRFLNIPESLATDNADGWEFLGSLGVRLRPDAGFFAIMLDWLLDESGSSMQAQAAIFRFYKELSVRFCDEPGQLLEHIFNKYPAVWIPASSRGSAKVVWLENCVWDGHPCLTTSLAQYPQYANDPHVAYLFKNVLQVEDAGLETYLSELISLRGVSLLNPPMEDLKAIYGIMAESTSGTEDADSVLKRFSESSLVYHPTQGWLHPELCLWTEAPKIYTQFGISAVYPELEDFFRGTLKVQVPTVATYIMQLRGLVAKHPISIGDIKATMHKLNTLLLESTKQEGLLDLKFLPVVMPGGSVEILEAAGTFFIADRIEHRHAFEGKVPFLDFSLEEARQLHRLLLVLGLEDRYTSVAVRERTVVEEPSEEPSPTETRVFRTKARHIYRCALHYNAVKPTGDAARGLQRLCGAVVSMSGGFKKTLELRLNEVVATVHSDTGLVHVDNSQDELRVYIPRNPKDRQRCYCLHLPQALARYFELRDPAASMMLQLVFSTGEEFIEDLLDGNGIIRLPSGILDPGEVDDISQFEHIDTLDDIPSALPLRPESREDSLAVEITSSHRRAVSPRSRPVTVSHPDAWPISPHGAEPPLSESPYVQLLDQVLRVARQITLREALQRPQAAVSNQATVAHELAFGIRSNNQTEHDQKIGAAGELFHVSVHPDYNTLLPWNGVETTDLVYHDSTSAMTTALIDMGHLSDAIWHGARPTYYIEVKTTTGAWDNAFFMSGNQYNQMETMQFNHDRTARTNEHIYVIFRVYNLGKDTMRAWLYIDPESLRREDALLFHPESYKVYPGLSEKVRFFSAHDME